MGAPSERWWRSGYVLRSFLTLPELESCGRDVQHLSRRLEPDVARERLGFHRLGIPLEHRNPISGEAWLPPGARRAYPGPALTIG